MKTAGTSSGFISLLAGILLAVLLAAGLRREPPPAAPAAAAAAAADWGRAASVVAAAAAAQLSWLESPEAVEDPELLAEICDGIAAAAEALLEDFHRRAARLSGDPAEARRLLREAIRDVLPRGPSRLFQVPPRSSVLFQPAPLANDPAQLQKTLERLLAALAKLLETQPPDSPAVLALQRSIDRIRALLGATDAVAPVVTNLLPAPGAVVPTAAPLVGARVADTGGSGLDPAQMKMQFDGLPVAPLVKVVDPNVLELSFVPPAPLADGLHSARVEARDRTGNVAAPASWTFEVRTAAPPGDLVAPRVDVVAPIDGETILGRTFAFEAIVADDGSGVDPGSIRVSLNGTDVTGLLRITPGSLNGGGNPVSVMLGGALETATPDNFIVVSAADVARNASSRAITFVASGFSRPPPRRLQLLKVSGDGQEGLAGKATDAPLVVRAIDQNAGGAPVAGLELRYRLAGGAGWPARDRAFLTGEDGTASFHFVFGLRESGNVVEVGILGYDAVPAVQFTLITRRPTLTDLSDQRTGPCNLFPSTSEFAGSALPKLLVFRLTDHLGRPMKGQDIVPFVKQYKGVEPPGVDLGYFVPSRGITNDQGEAAFAFVIHASIGDSGSFTLRFQAPAYVADDGEPVKADIGGQVRDPATKPRQLADTEIDFDDPARAGQGQIGVPGKRVNVPLRARFFAPGFPSGGGRIIFSIIEGDGTFEPGPEGRFLQTLPNPSCATLRYAMECDPHPESGIASVYFTLAAGYTHALIAMEGFTDIFVIGPPEVRTVQASRPDQEVLGLLIDDLSNPNPDALLQVEVRAPSGFGDPVTAVLASLDDTGAALVKPNAVAPSNLTAQLAKAGAHPENRYDIFRMSTPLRFTNVTLIPGQSVPSGPGLLQAVSGGGLSVLAQVGPAAAQPGPVVKEARIVKPALIAAVNETIQLKIENFPVKDAKVSWTIQRIDQAGPVLPLTNPRAKLSEVHFLFNHQRATATDLPGLSDDPVSINLPNLHAHRRAMYRVQATSDALPKDGSSRPIPLETILLVRLGGSGNVPGAPPPPADKAALNLAFPYYSAPASVNTFARLTDKLNNGLTALKTFNTTVAAGTNPENTLEDFRRLVYLGTEDPEDADTAGATPVGYLDDLTGVRGGLAPTQTTRPIGVVLYPKTQGFSLEDAQAVVDHETFHMRQLLGQTALSGLSRDLYNDIVGHFVADYATATAVDRQRNVGAYIQAGREAQGVLDELEAAYADLVAWPSNGESVYGLYGNLSNFYKNGYQKLVKLLIQGVSVVSTAGQGKLIRPSLAIRARLIAFVNDEAIPTLRAGPFRDMISEESISVSRPLGGQTPEEAKLRGLIRRLQE